MIYRSVKFEQDWQEERRCSGTKRQLDTSEDLSEQTKEQHG